MSPPRRIRVLIAKPGLDGHDRGAKVVAAALRDAGMEVVYTGLRAKASAIANAAVQEDVDVVGLSVLSGAHLALCRQVVSELAARGADIPILLGGIVPEEDLAELAALGVKDVFGPESPLSSIVSRVRALADRERVEEHSHAYP